MYVYDWDEETGGFLLRGDPLLFSKEPRPVYYREMDLLGFDKYYEYAKDDTWPYMWAEANNYIYRGRRVAQTKGGSLYVAPELILLDKLEPDGMPLRQVDIPQMIAKSREIMEDLTKETIKRVYNTYMKYKDRVDVFYVAFSGGKDSVVALDIVQKAVPHENLKVLFGDTQMEFPDTYDLIPEIEQFCANSDITFLHAKSDLSPEETWKVFGPPAQRIRWCCSVLKTTPQILLLRKILRNPHFRGMAFTGIRAAESPARSEYDDVTFGQKVKGQYSCHAILEWNSAELFYYIYMNNLILNESYKKGNGRVGCLVCPLAAGKNMFFKECAYSKPYNGQRTTTVFNDIILETTSKELNTKSEIEEFMNIGGWKARRSGRELKFGRNNTIEESTDAFVKITLLENRTDWKQWFKTLGYLLFTEDGNVIITTVDGEKYVIECGNEDGHEVFIFRFQQQTRKSILFVAALKTVLRKASNCIMCRVCEANCPNGYISMDDGQILIDDRCTKCQSCHDVFHGCLVANSLRMPKGDKKMASIDRYANLGIENEWLTAYFKAPEDFKLYFENKDQQPPFGPNKMKSLKSFLTDAGIIEKNSITSFGMIIREIGLNDPISWGLMLVNLAYTAEFGWWIRNIDFETPYSADVLMTMLAESAPSDNSRRHIVSAFKNTFASNETLGTELGCGITDCDIKNGKRFLKSITRVPWKDPDDRVILYTLYKYAEACDSYYAFTLSRLIDDESENEGISPTKLFGISRDKMERLLNGLSINYPQFINVSFTLGLDNINLNDAKTSADVLRELF